MSANVEFRNGVPVVVIPIVEMQMYENPLASLVATGNYIDINKYFSENLSSSEELFPYLDNILIKEYYEMLISHANSYSKNPGYAERRITNAMVAAARKYYPYIINKYVIGSTGRNVDIVGRSVLSYALSNENNAKIIEFLIRDSTINYDSIDISPWGGASSQKINKSLFSIITQLDRSPSGTILYNFYKKESMALTVTPGTRYISLFPFYNATHENQL